MTRPSNEVRTETSRVADIAVPGATTLRLAVTGEGEDAVLIIAHGLGGQGREPFRRPAHSGPPIRLPASVLPDLVEALKALGDEER